MIIIYKLITVSTALVWLVNGLICKVLNFVPRHQEIVARILGQQFSRELILAIGIAEVVMAIWLLSGYKSRLCTILQIATVLVMNTLEALFAPDLLLYGYVNFMWATLFCITIGVNEFLFRPHAKPQTPAAS